jgi:hypothetical protein
MCKFFSKFLHRKKESLQEKPPWLIELQRYYLSAFSGKKHELNLIDKMDLIETTKLEKMQLQIRINEIEQRLTTLEQFLIGESENLVHQKRIQIS